MNVQETAAGYSGESGERILPALKKYIPGLMAAAVSALMNRAMLPGGYIPLGAAFMAAVPQQYAAAAAAGGVLSCLTGGGTLTSMEGLRRVASLLAVCGIRWALGELRAVNRAKYYPFFAALAGVLMTNTVINGTTGSVISYSTLYFLTEGAMAGLAAMFFSGACRAAERFGSGERLSRTASVSLLITLCAAAIPLCRLRILGFSPGMMLLHAAVLLVASSRSETGGAISGIAVGWVASLSRYSIAQGAVIPAAAVLAGYAAFYGRVFAAAAYIACCFMGSLTAGSFDYRLVAEAAAGGIISCLVPAMYAEKALAAAGFGKVFSHADTYEAPVSERLHGAARSLSDICSLLGKVSDGLDKRDLPAEETNRSRYAGIRSAMKGELEGVGMLLRKLGEELSEGREDEYLSREIAEHLTLRGYGVISCSCSVNPRGRRILQLTVRRRGQPEAEKLAECAGECLDCGFEVAAAETDRDTMDVALEQTEKYALVCAGAQHSCGGQKLCGDSYLSFRDGWGGGYLLLSDGMGSGGRAAVEGALTCELFRRLLEGGFDFDSAVKIVNSALMVKSDDETLSTADCLHVNLFNGRAVISKAGAAQSYHVRDGVVTRIDLPSLPLGILSETDTARHSFTAESGDLIVMISDGVPTDESLWFEDMLKNSDVRDIGTFAQLLLEAAVSRRPEGEDDDITVTVG